MLSCCLRCICDYCVRSIALASQAKEALPTEDSRISKMLRRQEWQHNIDLLQNDIAAEKLWLRKTTQLIMEWKRKVRAVRTARIASEHDLEQLQEIRCVLHVFIYLCVFLSISFIFFSLLLDDFCLPSCASFCSVLFVCGIVSKDFEAMHSGKRRQLQAKGILPCMLLLLFESCHLLSAIWLFLFFLFVYALVGASFLNCISSDGLTRLYLC